MPMEHDLLKCFQVLFQRTPVQPQTRSEQPKLDIPDLKQLKMEAVDNPTRLTLNSNPAYSQNIHPSQFLNNFCLRRMYYASNYAELQPNSRVVSHVKPFPYPDERRMSVGTAFHEMERKFYVTHYRNERYVPYGKWVCSNCQAQVMGTKPTEKCPNHVEVKTNGSTTSVRDCSEGHWVYAECPFEDERFNLMGTADLVLIDKTNDDRIVVDYKSADDDIYRDIKMGLKVVPLANKLQIQLNIIGTKSKYGILNYISRKYPDNEVSVIIYPDPEIEKQLVDIKNLLKYHLSESEAPPKRKEGCATKRGTVASRCIFRDLCFDI